MGRKSRERMAEKDPDKKGWFTRKKEQFADKREEALDKAWYQARTKYHARWMEMSGCNHPNMINYDIPTIELEVALCDVRNLRLIRKGRHRDEFLATLSPEARKVYSEAVDGDGNRYTDLENPKVLRSMITGIKQAWRDRNGGRIDPETEAVLDSMIEDEDENVTNAQFPGTE